LILEYDKFVVVLEAKTGSEEHEAPSGILQTMAYPDAVRRAVHIDRSKPVYIVFITPDKSEAANPEAINTTFVEFALSLAAALETIPLPDDLRFAYAMLFTHFLTYAVPPGIDTRSVVQKMDGWVVGAADDTYLVSIMGEVSAVAKLFGVEML
jgi:hypothetical protein